MRAGWLKVGVLAGVLALVVAGYLVGRSTSGDGEEPVGRAETAPSSPAGQVKTIRDALSGAGEVAVLKTERCPTQSSVGGGYVRPPSEVRVRMPAGSSSQLRAYVAATGTLLPAPAHWECTASSAADGTQEIGVGPSGSVRAGAYGFPELRRRGPAVRATLIPGCAGCIAEAICSFFSDPEVVKPYESSLSCETRRKGELRFRLSASAYVILDPPGVDGTLPGSGGSLPALGMLSYTRATGVHQLSCILAASELDTCADAVVAFAALERLP